MPLTFREMLDLPPVWLALALACVWALDRVVPLGLFGPAGEVAGKAAVALGVLLMLAAVAQMALRRTTVIPRRDPSALVTGGVYAISRNPIYLADALILAGVVLWADVPLAAPLVPAFMALIQRRFIRGEEARIAAAFGADFAAYAVRTPRWLGWPRGGNGD